MEKAIIVSNITKKYTLYNDMKERLFDLVTPKSYGEDFYALNDVSFEAEKGDIIGFIGTNGSGKSTLSNIIAGIVPETSGTVQVNGSTSLIAVSAGLKAELTGRDNIELKCLMLGFSEKEIKKLEPEIIEFSELGVFIDQPVKSYSSGMKSRLGFAISVNVDPEILIIDEALSVGDKAFAEKSLSKMKEFKGLGKTMVFVSHSLGQMREFCEKILWLEFGRVKEFGKMEEVIPKYEKFLDEWQKMSKEEREVYKRLSINQDEKGLKSLINVDNEDDMDDEEKIYSEEAVSRMGHIRGKATYIYQTPKNFKDSFPAEDYKHSSYYIKKEAFYNNEEFYLLSNEPSAMKGIVGWMKASEVASRLHIHIDSDFKTFKIKGTADPAYNRPWGGTKNIVLDTTENEYGSEFIAENTEKIGNNFWFYGMLAGQYVWVHESQLS